MKQIISTILLLYCLFLGGSILKMINSQQVVDDEVNDLYGNIQTDGSNKYSSTIRLIRNNSFFCSGVVIDGTYALTAAHCVENDFGRLNTDEIQINDVTDNYTGTRAHAVALDQLRDVALLKGDFRQFQTQTPDFDGDSSQQSGNIIKSCGFPSGGKLYCTFLAIEGNMNFQIASRGSTIYKGMSGGPVVSIVTGKVIGVNSAVNGPSVIVGPLLGVGQIFRIRE
jgi:hypothetical protein